VGLEVGFMSKKILLVLSMLSCITFSSHLLAAACPYLNKVWPVGSKMEFDGNACVFTTSDNIRFTIWDPNYEAKSLKDCFEHYQTNAELYNLTLFRTQLRSVEDTAFLCEYHYYGHSSYMDLFIVVAKENFCPIDSHWNLVDSSDYVCDASNYACDFKLDGTCNNKENK
jgi:hypothetical protein